MLRTILAATDGSECAEKATELAADLAKRYGARLVLLHVWQADALTGAPASLAGGPLIVAPLLERRDEQRALEAPRENILTMARHTAREFGAQSIATLSVEGDPVSQILQCAEYEMADLIVMGSRGLSQLKRLLLGGVSLEVTRRAPCPTLTVK